MHTIVLLTAFVAVIAVPTLKVGTRSIVAEHDTLFARFKAEHSKQYNTESEEAQRKDIFINNLERIRAHNEQAARGLHTFTMAMNHFGDLTAAEFRALVSRLSKRPNTTKARDVADLSHVTAAQSVDWQAAGFDSPVGNQGMCGSCWAFTATGTVEGAWFVKNQTLHWLSAQQLMDCSTDEGNQGCSGGLMDNAFSYYEQNGACTEESYPYIGQDSEGACKPCTPVVNVSSFQDIEKTEAALARAVTQQPVSSAIDPNTDFQFYSSGIITSDCGTSIEHSLVVVGYGELNGTEYWRIKNSWGTAWGTYGYAMIVKGKTPNGGQCGIALEASIALV